MRQSLSSPWAERSEWACFHALISEWDSLPTLKDPGLNVGAGSGPATSVSQPVLCNKPPASRWLRATTVVFPASRSAVRLGSAGQFWSRPDLAHLTW